MIKVHQKTVMLYVLQGSIVTGDAFIAFCSLSEDDITKSKHMRFGHMRENGMAKLNRRGVLDG